MPPVAQRSLPERLLRSKWTWITVAVLDSGVNDEQEISAPADAQPIAHTVIAALLPTFERDSMLAVARAEQRRVGGVDLR